MSTLAGESSDIAGRHRDIESRGFGAGALAAEDLDCSLRNLKAYL